MEVMSATAPSFDTVLAWHWREWGHAEADADVEEWRGRLAGRCRNDAIPFTLLAHIAADPVGCVTVCNEDRDPRFADHGPWLAGMIVVGPARNLGVGRTLLRAAEQQASIFGASELWVYTSEAGPFYERCGWTFRHRKNGLRDVAVMVRERALSA